MFPSGTAHEAGQPHPRIVERRLRPGKGRAVIREVNDERRFVAARRFQNAQQMSHPLIESRNRLVVFGQFRAAGGRVGQIRGHPHVLRPINHGHNFRITRRPIPEAVGIRKSIERGLAVRQHRVGAMRIVAGEIEKERPVILRLDHAARLLRHLDRTAADRGGVVGGATGEHRLKRIDGLGADVKFPDPRRAVASRREQYRQALHVVERLEMVVVMLQAIHAVAMVLLAREDHRTRRTAARRGAKRVSEPRAIRRQRVEVGRLDHRVAVAAERIATVIVSDDQYDVGSHRHRRRGVPPADRREEYPQRKNIPARRKGSGHLTFISPAIRSSKSVIFVAASLSSTFVPSHVS